MGGRVDVELNLYIFYFWTLVLFYCLDIDLFIEFFDTSERALGKIKLYALF